MAGFRRPRTTGEMRQNAALLDEDAVGVRVRRARTGKGLPSERDDVAPACAGDRSWKRFRRFQRRSR